MIQRHIDIRLTWGTVSPENGYSLNYRGGSRFFIHHHFGGSPRLVLSIGDHRLVAPPSHLVKTPLLRSYGIWSRWLVQRTIMAPFHAFVVLSPIRSQKGAELEPGDSGSLAWVVVEATRDRRQSEFRAPVFECLGAFSSTNARPVAFTHGRAQRETFCLCWWCLAVSALIYWSPRSLILQAPAQQLHHLSRHVVRQQAIIPGVS